MLTIGNEMTTSPRLYCVIISWCDIDFTESCIFDNILNDKRNYTVLADRTWRILQQCENDVEGFSAICNMINWNDSRTCNSKMIVLHMFAS